MTFDQAIVSLTLLFCIIMFIWGKVRYDIVALIGLFITIVTGVVDSSQAFIGFSEPAVIMVACILILSHILQTSGVMEGLVGKLERYNLSHSMRVLVIMSIVSFTSAFMNNVGALALLLPAVISYAAKSNVSPSSLLMPLSFGSLLGGLITLVGTPPNLIISSFRENRVGEGFFMFDFALVGLPVAITGILFIALVGYRLLPHRTGKGDVSHAIINHYSSEVIIPQGSELSGKYVRFIEKEANNEIAVIGLIRGSHTLLSPSGFDILHEGDILLLEGSNSAIVQIMNKFKLLFFYNKEQLPANIQNDNFTTIEAVITAESRLENKRIRHIDFLNRFGVHIVGIARQGKSIIDRFHTLKLKAGDAIAIMGDRDVLSKVIKTFELLPLASSDNNQLSLSSPKKIIWIFILSILAASLQIVPPVVAFLGGVIVMVLCNCISLRNLYDSVEMPVLVLLGAMIPIGYALESTGTASLIVAQLMYVTHGFPIWLIIALLMLVTMLLSDVINNATTALIMAPIAAEIAQSLNVDMDMFLMAVAIASSSTFLTPIGHQSNILVMGPGGYKFSDYWKLGLPLDAIIITIATPLLIYVWGA
jgi:di/tricarboxylate transporter